MYWQILTMYWHHRARRQESVSTCQIAWGIRTHHANPRANYGQDAVSSVGQKKELFGAVDLNLLALRRRTQPHTAKQMLDNILI